MVVNKALVNLNDDTHGSSKNLWAKWFGRGKSVYQENEKLRHDKSYLEAFLSAFPGEYCGWAGNQQEAIYSSGFCEMLGLKTVHTINDVQGAFVPADGAALESLFSRLQNTGIGFSLSVKSATDEKVYKLSGSCGRDLGGHESFDILWLEDVSDEVAARELFVQENEEKESEIFRLKTILDTVPRPLWVRNKDMKIIWCNETYADFLGHDYAEIIDNQREIYGQLRDFKKTKTQDTPPGPPLAKKAIKSGTPQQARVHNTIKGKRMLLNVTEIPLTDLGFNLGIAYNVTREEDLETELKRYQSSNRELLGQLRSAVAIYAADQSLEFFNGAFAQLWGLEETWLHTNPSLGDIMEKLREQRRLPEQSDFRKYKQGWLNMFRDLLQPAEDLLHLPDGTTLRMLVMPHSMGGLMMTFEDVSGHLALESSYNTLIAVQRETIDNLVEGIAVYGEDGRLKLYNPSFARLWGLNPEDLEGQPHISRIVERKKSFFAADEWEERKREILNKVLQRKVNNNRLECSGDKLIDYSTVPLPDGGVLVSYTDVTDTARVEQALRDKNLALETAERLKLDFLANVSYQLRTPLNAIMGFNEILDQEYFGTLNERQKEYTRDIHIASERLLGLINDILDLSTLEAGYMALERSEVKLYNMLTTVGELVEEWVRKQDIQLIVQCPKNIGTINADERRLRQAVINLIHNAISYTPAGGEITIQGQRKKDGFYITVSDTGVGISEKEIKRIFEPFERARAGQGQLSGASGAGLGLSLVKKIIALHGGGVKVESTQGKGTDITLHIPLVNINTKK